MLLSFEVAVWATRSLLTHTTVSPTTTESVSPAQTWSHRR